MKKVNVDENGIYWNDKLTLPYKPHIGTLSCSPEIDSINSLTPDNHGGNMDVPDVAPGAIVYLPVRSPGARIFIGDAHACQGDGELCGTGVEIASCTTIHVDLIKGRNLHWPRLEDEDLIMAIGSATLGGRDMNRLSRTCLLVGKNSTAFPVTMHTCCSANVESCDWECRRFEIFGGRGNQEDVFGEADGLAVRCSRTLQAPIKKMWVSRTASFVRKR